MKLVLVILTLSALLATADHDFDNLYVTRKKLLFKKHVLTKEEFVEYATLSDVSHMKTAAQRMAIPRVVGTRNHAKVRDYVVESLKQLDWSVEVQSFHDETPIFGKLQFHNIIAKLNPNAEHYLMLACHYDSKYFDEFEFVGATDSAVPCAILLNLAHVFQKHLKALRHKSISLMLVFFDGEEAFLDWNERDSIYGARHMAKTWKENEFLDKVDILMLLDLIGMPDPRFYSYFANTENWFSHLLDIEDRLADTGILAQYASSGIVGYNQNRYFQEQHFGSAFVEDDHIPFLKRGVPILHLIPNPFPDCWHTPADNITMIDFVTTENIARIIRIFTIEYLLSESN